MVSVRFSWSAWITVDKMPDPTDLYVLIPYKDLEALLGAARELPSIRDELRLCRIQMDKLRAIQTQTMDMYKALFKML